MEPYEVPTAGAFFMHDDRFGGDDGKGRCGTAWMAVSQCTISTVI